MWINNFSKFYENQQFLETSQNVCPMGSAVLIFIGYKQTNKQGIKILGF